MSSPKSCVVCRAGSSLWSQKLELDVNPFPVKTRTLFGGQSTKKKVFIPQAWSDLSYVCSRLVASYYCHSCFSCSPPTTFPYFGTLWQKTMTQLRKEKAIDYLRPCSQRLSTFSIWYWGEPAIKHRPKLSKRWKKHTLIYQTWIKKIRREIKARKHLVSSDFDRETNSIWLNQRKEQVAHGSNNEILLCRPEVKGGMELEIILAFVNQL